MPTTRKPGALGALTMAVALMALLGLLALGGGDALAKKPPKPPPPDPDPPAPADTGLIYFVEESAGLYTMDTDGTDKTPVAGRPTVGSLALHGGRRWFLEFREIPGETYPTPEGTLTTAVWTRHELWAVPEFDGEGEDSDAWQLTSDDSVQPNFLRNGDAGRTQLAWSVDDGDVDGKVSYVALRWGADGVLVDWGVQEIYLDWSTMTASAASTMIPVGPYRIVPNNGTRWVPVGYAWNRDGDAIAYSNSDQGGLRRIDAVDGWMTPDVLITSGWIQGLDWSPNGTCIAFYTLNITNPTSAEAWKWDVETISSTGSGRTIVIEHTSTSGAWGPMWSPSGTHLVYTRGSARRSKDTVPSTIDVYVALGDGTDATNLTGDVAAKSYAGAWRDE